MTGSKTHKCAAEGCLKQTSTRMLMCLACWRRVPDELQRKLWKAYRRKDASGAAHLTREYVGAVRECVEAVKAAREKERASADAKYQKAETRAQDSQSRQGQLGLEQAVDP